MLNFLRGGILVIIRNSLLFIISLFRYAEESVDLLLNSGLQFDRHEREGIEPIHFAEMLMVSGIVLLDNVKWLSFHSGYDFGYLLSMLTNTNLPEGETEFFETLKTYFPNIYDVKYLMKSCKNLKGGLQEVADMLEVERIGPQHQAGSDSLLTGKAFFKMTEIYFEDELDDSKVTYEIIILSYIIYIIYFILSVSGSPVWTE